MAQSVEDLYQQYAGRASDPEGLAYWTERFGDAIDPNEIGIFEGSVAAARAQGTEPAAKTTFAPTATVAAPLSMQDVANTPGLGATGIGVNVAPVINATREQVLSAYANNPLAELNPSEEAINYWMSTGVGDFNSVVDQVRAENPALAASIDASRSSNGGALNQVTGNTDTTGAAVRGGDAFTGDTNTTGTTGALSQVTGSAATGAGVVGGNTAATTGGTGAAALNNNHVIALGDSTTYGYNAGNRLDTNMVSSAQTALGSNYTIDNLGVNSTTVGDLLSGSGGTGSNWANTLASDAGVVVLNYGLNEAYRGEDPATFAANLTKAVNDLKATGKSVILQTPNIVTGEAWTNNVDPYVNIIRSVAAATGSVLDDKYAATGAMDSFFDAATGDTIHPSSSAYAALGVNLANVISGLSAQRASTGTGSAAATGVTTGTATDTTADTTAAADTTTVLPGALSQAANTSGADTTSVADLYRNVLGREPDAEGLEYWSRQFGSSVSPEERALFQQSAQTELDSRTQDLYTEFMGSGRVAEKEGLDYWRERFGNEIDASEREEFRQAASAELNKNFGEGNAGLLAGFKYAKDLGISDEGLKKTLGEDLYNQYKNQLKTFATTNISDIVADNSLTFAESQAVHGLARDLGFNSQQLADLTGKDKSLYDTILTNYDTNSKKIINDTLTGPSILTDADRVVASYALEKQFGFTDEEISKATGVDVKTIKASLDPVRNFEADFSKIANNTDSTTQQLKDFVLNAKSNAAIDKLYGEALTGYENRIAELENKWSSYGTDAVQSENLFQQLSAQRDALGGQYFQGVFGDLMNSAALLVKKGVDTIGDLGQKDKFQTTQATERITTADGRPVTKQGDEYFLSETDSEGYPILGAKVDPSSVTKKYFKTVTEGDGENSYSTLVPLSEAELATVKDGSYQQKIGSVVIDKDTGAELTDTTGQLAFQRSGGHLKSRKHWLYANFTDEGVPYLTARQEKSGIYGFVSDVGPMIISIASMIPGPHQPFAMAANAALAASQKNYLGAVLSGLGAYGTFTGNELTALNMAEASGDIINASQVLDLQNTASNIKLAQTAVAGFAALQQENLAGVINAGLSAYGQTGGVLPSGVTTALQAVNLATALESDNISGALMALGDLTGSKDLYVAASAKNLVDALQSGNISNITQAGLVFGNSFQAANQARNTTDTGGIQNRVTDDMTEAGAAVFADASRAGASDADALSASNVLTTIADANETFDGSGFDNQNAAMNAAIADGKDKFTFGGKTFTIDNSAAMIADLESSVAADTAARANSDSEWGNLAGAITDATARNTVTIGNAEADNADEALYLARARDPSATSFTFDGKTYTISASQAQMADANRTATLAEIRDLPAFNDAYARARTLLGPNQTFEWNGKQYSTATAAERPDLNITSADLAIEKLNATNLATNTDASNTVGAQTDTTARIYGSAENQSAAETARLANLNAGLSASASKASADAAKAAINSVLGDGFASDLVTQGLSNLHQAVGQTMAFFGGAGSAVGLAGPNNTLTRAGNAAAQAGEDIQLEAINEANSNVINAVQKADGFLGKVVAGAKAIYENPLSANMAAIELLQEAMPIGVAAKIYSMAGKFGSLKKAGAITADVGLNAIESGGTAYNERYEEGIKAGKTPEQADKDATTSFWVASAVTAVTGGITDMALVNKITKSLDDAAAKAVTKPVSSGAVSAAKEAPAEMAEVFATGVLTALALGEKPDINKILTQTVVEGYVGGKTAGSIDAASSAIDVTSGAANTAATASISNNINTAIASGNAGNINSVITDNVTTSLASGAGAAVVIDSAITSAITGGADAASAINSTVTAAIQGGADASQVVASTITSAANAGADASLAINSTVTSAITGGADASQVISSAITAGAGSSVVTGNVINSTVTAAITAGANTSTVLGSTITSSLGTGADAATVINSSVTAALNAGGNADTVVASSVSAAVNAGGNVTTVVGTSVTAAITAGANVTTAVDSAVTAAATTGASVDTAVASSVAAAVTAGADVNSAVTAAVDAAVTAGNNVTVASDANAVTISNATTNTQTTVNTTTGVTTTVDSASNVTTTVDGNTTTAVDANNNTTSQTTVDGNTQTTVVADANANTNTQIVVNNNTTTSTTVDSSNNTTTQTTFDANTNTQTTVVTDVNSNTQTTINVNANTGDLIDQKETAIPAGWKTPVIEPPVVPPTATASSSSSAADAAKQAAKKSPKAPGGSGAGAGGFGLPVGMDLNPASLTSRETQKAIDPLARVKAIQAEFERDAMMQNVDPRLMQILQQRSDPQQQSKQFDDDIGALAKLLGGKPDAPSSNASNYYSYGSEDSIDDILGGKAANYKEGGFVEPLKASGGSMALPLLAKAGGALGHYKGRENFKEGKHVAGEGDGQSDDIPAWLADGEFVFPADVVSALGNGSTKAGTDKLYEMMHSIRDRARSKGPKDLPPPALKSPLDYLKSSKRSTS